MEKDTILLASSPIIAGVIVFLLGKVKRGNKWRVVKQRDIPIWLLHFLYNRKWRDNKGQASGEVVIKGAYFEYRVKFKSIVSEPSARIKNIVVHQRIQNDNYKSRKEGVI